MSVIIIDVDIIQMYCFIIRGVVCLSIFTVSFIIIRSVRSSIYTVIIISLLIVIVIVISVLIVIVIVHLYNVSSSFIYYLTVSMIHSITNQYPLLYYQKYISPHLYPPSTISN